MRRTLLTAGLSTMLLALAPTGAVAAGLVQENVEQAKCWNDLDVVFCLAITLRLHLNCELLEPGVGRCTSTSEWYWAASSFIGLPGEGYGAYSDVFEWDGPGGSGGASGFAGTFERCAWEATDPIGCNARDLLNRDTGPVALAPGECLVATLWLEVSAAAFAPFEQPVAVMPLDDAAQHTISNSVCG